MKRIQSPDEEDPDEEDEERCSCLNRHAVTGFGPSFLFSVLFDELI
jgi:hypothetical protein